MSLFKRNREPKQGHKFGFLKRSGKNKGQKQKDADSSSGIGSDGTPNTAAIEGTIDVAPDTAVAINSADDAGINISNDNTVGGAIDPAVDKLQYSTLDASTVTLNHESPPNQTLWDCAYDSLRKENQQLVENYEKLLSKELLGSSTSPALFLM
jgi:N-terminal domain of NWD NACHT-NTPase